MWQTWGSLKETEHSSKIFAECQKWVPYAVSTLYHSECCNTSVICTTLFKNRKTYCASVNSRASANLTCYVKLTLVVVAYKVACTLTLTMQVRVCAALCEIGFVFSKCLKSQRKKKFVCPGHLLYCHSNLPTQIKRLLFLTAPMLR